MVFPKKYVYRRYFYRPDTKRYDDSSFKTLRFYFHSTITRLSVLIIYIITIRDKCSRAVNWSKLMSCWGTKPEILIITSSDIGCPLSNSSPSKLPKIWHECIGEWRDWKLLVIIYTYIYRTKVYLSSGD